MIFFVVSIQGVTQGYNDLSYNKKASQSPIYHGIYELYVASHAVDKKPETCMRANDIGYHSPDKTTWWKVDLGGVYSIHSINILFKNYDGYETRQQGRFAGFYLFVSNTDVSSRSDILGSTLCYKDGPQLPPLNFTTMCRQYGRYVIYYNERLNEVLYPDGYKVTGVYTELCEVIIQGCSTHGVYGNQCNIPCPSNCKEKACHIENGTCFTCEPGWTGTFCTEKCSEGRYGVQCIGICSGHCTDGTTCNHVTGQCDGGCAAGWTGHLCDTDCNDETYGYDCANNCSRRCINGSPCNKHTGFCDEGCKAGFTNVFCSEKCRPGYYGNKCGLLCNGYCLNNGICNHVDGVCLAGCQDGYIGKYCNNSCTEGYFGKNCSYVCSPHCKICRHTDGHCSCSAGYTGFGCTTACFQSYGENCKHPCSQHCYNRNCDRFNGSCLTGCTDGFYGERCDKDTQMLRQDTSPSISWIVGLSICFAVNIILIICICVMCREKYGKKGLVSGNFLYCLKKPDFYQDTNATIEEPSTYQELTVPVPKSMLPYDNITLK